MARVRVRLDLGPGATLGALAEVVQDMSTAMDLGLRVDRRLARVTATREIDRLWREEPLRLVERVHGLSELTTERFRATAEARARLDEWYRLQFRGYEEPYDIPLFTWLRLEAQNLHVIDPGIYEQLVADEVRRRLAPVPSVQALTYQNPLELVILVMVVAGLKYGTFVELLKIIRDWNISRARARANTDKTTAEAREISARASKIEFETELRRKLVALGIYKTDLDEVDLSPSELQAVSQLSATVAEVEIEDD